MDIIESIQKKYGLENGYEEFTKISPHVYEKQLEPKYDVDYLDHCNVWSHGQVFKISFDLANCRWKLHISFKNWSNSRPVELLTYCDQNFPNKITEYGTNLLVLNALEKNKEITPDNYHFSVKPRRVMCYISSEKQTLKHKHKWCIAKQMSDGTVKLTTSSKRTHKIFRGTVVQTMGTVLPIDSVYITAPICKKIFHEYKEIFKLKQAIILKKIKKKRNKEKQEKKKIVQDIKKNKTIILNKHTVTFLRMKPKIVSKSCIGWKNGWVNRYGKSQMWTKSRGLFDAYLTRYLTAYMGGKDTLSFACTNRKNNYETINYSYLKSQHKSLNKKIKQLEEQTIRNELARKEQHSHISKIKSSLRKLPNIDELISTKDELNKILHNIEKEKKDNEKIIKDEKEYLKILKEKIHQHSLYI